MVNLKSLDYRHKKFNDDETQSVLDQIASGDADWIQVRLDSQYLCDCARERIFKLAMERDMVLEIAIFGFGAAVSVKKIVPPALVWDEKNKRDVPVEQWNREHPENQVRTDYAALPRPKTAIQGSATN